MNKFANLVVHLNEDNFEEVKELLLSKGEKNDGTLQLFKDENYNYLYYDQDYDKWSVSVKFPADKEITLEEFKRLINEK